MPVIRVEKVEGPVWSFVSGLLKDPERLRAGMDALIEAELAQGGDPGRDARILHEKMDECARSRAAYQDQQAAGLMTLDGLAVRLEELDRARRLAEAELANLSEREKRAVDLSRDKEMLSGFYSKTAPREMDSLSPEDKNHVYRLLRLEVAPVGESFRVSGAFCSSEGSCFVKGSPLPLPPFRETSSGRSQYFASPTAGALPRRSSSFRVRPLFAFSEAASR